jgi:putative toxin-antitoxin system antitoxin component (TIGR02293 family)
MLAEVMHAAAYRAYRIRLQALLHIPLDATAQEIHQLIAAGFTATRVEWFCTRGAFIADALNQIMSLKTLHGRVARGQRLTLGESDRLYRLAHVTAMAEVLFGDEQKAWRWLCKPKQRFAGQSPLALLSTSPGMQLVEELLIQIDVGVAG